MTHTKKTLVAIIKTGIRAMEGDAGSAIAFKIASEIVLREENARPLPLKTYYSGCHLTDQPETPGKWEGITFTAEDGSTWTRPEGEPSEGTGVYYLRPLAPPFVFARF